MPGDDEKRRKDPEGTLDRLLGALAPPVEDLSGATIAHYRVEAKLGQGGMGVVYRARDSRLARDLALKVLPASVAADGERRARMLREARSAAAVNHQNIAAVYDVGESEGRVYLAMELVEGATLRDRLAAGALPAEEAVRIARGIAAGLARAHEKGIVHRDLKPENVMLGRDGAVKILDFGLAKLREPDSTDSALAKRDTQTLEGRVMGTPGYMSPEQAAGRPVDQSTDVYALGAVLHEMLTGGLPGMGRGRKPIPDARLEAIVAKCLEPWPDQRWPDGARVAKALEDIGQLAIPARAPSRRVAWLGAGALVILAAGGALVARAARQSPHAPSAAPVSSPAPAPKATTLASLPLPASTVPEAIDEYKAGLRIERDGHEVGAKKHFQRAAELDPGMAMAHFRIALNAWRGEESRREFERATALRGQLGERDGTLFEAMEPVLGRAEPDDALAIERLRAARQRYPLDEEFALRLGWETPGDLPLARETIALDPDDASAWQNLGRSLAIGGDLEGSHRAFETCAAKAVDTAFCHTWLALIDAAEGRCADMETESRRAIDFDKELAPAYLVYAARAAGRPEAIVRELIARDVATAPEDERDIGSDLWELDLALFSGQFRDAIPRLRRIRQRESARGWHDMASNYRLAKREIGVLTETGSPAAAREAARQFVDRLDILEQSDRIDSGVFGTFAMLRAAGEPLEPRRHDWVELALRSGVPGSVVWTAAWALPAVTAEDASEGLRALGSDPRLSFATGGEDAWEAGLGASGATGHVMLLAGKPAAAIPHLRRQVADCFSLREIFETVHAQLDLGTALEATGDNAGACDAYAQVLARWGHATPRSVTAEAAREGVKRLHCAQ